MSTPKATAKTITKPMLIDKRFIHITPTLILVPYLPIHVPKYHGWMSNEAILQQTASESLSLEEEFAMQVTWATDEDKRTCILIPRADLHSEMMKIELNSTESNPIQYLDNDDTILPTHIVDRCGTNTIGKCSFCHKDNVIVTTLIINDEANKKEEEQQQQQQESRQCCLLCEANAACGDIGVEVAVGDVNIFIHEYLQDDDDGDNDGNSSSDDRVVGLDDETPPPTVAEIEIMIAEVSARRKGYGAIAVKALTQYSVEYLGMERIIAKISEDNTPSRCMFEKLGYIVYATVECFEEVHLDWKLKRAKDYPFYDVPMVQKRPQ